MADEVTKNKTGPIENPTLCWSCANAVPNKAGTRGCSWSRELVPVEGWTAVPQFKGGAETYLVLGCPYYEQDSPKTTKPGPKPIEDREPSKREKFVMRWKQRQQEEREDEDVPDTLTMMMGGWK